MTIISKYLLLPRPINTKYWATKPLVPDGTLANLDSRDYARFREQLLDALSEEGEV